MARRKGPTPQEEMLETQIELLTDVRDLLCAVLTVSVCQVCRGTGALKEATAKMAHASPMHQAAAIMVDAMKPCQCRLNAQDLLEEIRKAEEDEDEDEG